ncbi:hypothetical protein VIGAN_02302500, partial [Vigna angularis var. angularis]
CTLYRRFISFPSLLFVLLQILILFFLYHPFKLSLFTFSLFFFFSNFLLCIALLQRQWTVVATTTPAPSKRFSGTSRAAGLA